MHLLATSATHLDEIVGAVDLAQPPGDIAILSFADSDLTALASAWQAEQNALPRVRLAHLRDLRHPMSVDLWIERVGMNAKVIVVRLLGGLDWWKYGAERLAALARKRGIALALLPGEDRDDPRLAAASTLPAAELRVLLDYFREGGSGNLRALLWRLTRHAGFAVEVREPQPLPRLGGYIPGEGAVEIARLVPSLAAGKAVVPIIFYRALLLAADMAPVDALCTALAARGLAPAPLFIPSLKAREAIDFLSETLAPLHPAVIVTMTAFAAGADADEADLFAAADVPVLQVVSATTRRCRSCDARSIARARRPHSFRGDRLQGGAAATGGSCIHSVGELARARSGGNGGGSHRCFCSAAAMSAPGTLHRRIDA
jgi:cobaltochelatase CobN